MAESRMSAVMLSRGSRWNPLPWEHPYLGVDPGALWDVTAAASATFYDTSGAVITSIDGAVTPTAITFDADPDQVDVIPAGANFEIFYTTTAGPTQIRYGKVVRREATFFQSPAVTTTFQPLQFTDTFPTLGLRSTWEAVAGVTRASTTAHRPCRTGSAPTPGSCGWAGSSPLSAGSPR